MRVINSVCGHAPKGYCYRSKHVIDVQAESKPLPKRLRLRQKSKLKENASLNCQLDDETVNRSKDELRDITTSATTDPPDEDIPLKDEDDLSEGTLSSLEAKELYDVSTVALKVALCDDEHVTTSMRR